MGKRRVLLVDDSVAITRQLKKILEDSGEFEVVGRGANGVEGIKLFSQLRPDVVLMDLVMPEMDGLQAIRSIMTMDKDAAVVVVSSAGGVADKVMEALRFGARNVISKPFDPEQVIAVLRNI